MIYEVVFTDYSFKFDNIEDASKFAKMAAEHGEHEHFVKNEHDDHYHEEWKPIEHISIRLKKNESPADAT